MCVSAKFSATVVLFNIFSTSRKHFVSQAILLHRAISSPNVDGTASQTTVPGYHKLSVAGYETSCVLVGVCGDRASTAVAECCGEHTPSSIICLSLEPPGILYFLIFFRENYCRSLLSAGGHTESTRLLTGPGLITWALGCSFGTLLFV